MPRAWSDKDERQYEHIKEGAEKHGKGKRAKEIAARTVNKRRSQEGRTKEQQEGGKKSTRGGTGNPNVRLDERPVKELRNRARQLGISGYSKLKKQELVSAIRGGH